MPWLERSLLEDTDVIKPSVHIEGGPVRVHEEAPPEGWVPPGPVGFVR